ncbi:PREDICTED: adenylate isopentenyltransferase 3, chloroplastic-like [Nelumbo nucifera]|uniref:Uncharacterized protein n=2 Tax=Nelumbo nucifera TaxID=4432 RepID=A0A822YPG7_NELNU|nr:PREDICTED: adenylate isopentenyltransferase 3, chloroplastic-like [Nelumbo nucifera]DAD33229.1 TPA_asm: hypothetical protein HUJ06_012080 [Nelumbo nucifera]
MDRFLRAKAAAPEDEETLVILLEEAIEEIKVNTYTLARCQLQKIYRLKEMLRRKMHCLDAIGVFLKHDKEAEEAWEKLVAGPGTNIVRHFFYKAEDHTPTAFATTATIKAAIMGKATTTVLVGGR